MTAPEPTPLRPRPATSKRGRREQPIEKAARLIAEDRVMLDPDAQVYRVLGEHSTYNVIASADGIWCPCPARTPLCAHVIAAALVRQRGKHVPDRLVRDLGMGDQS